MYRYWSLASAYFCIAGHLAVLCLLFLLSIGFKLGLREFALVHVTFNFGIMLLTRYMSFSFFKKWREIHSSTLACRESGEIRHPLLSSFKDKFEWKNKKFQLM